MGKRTPFKDITKQYNTYENTKSLFNSPQEKININQKQNSRNFQQNKRNPSKIYAVSQGNDYYSQAKKAEYSQRDLVLAEQLYRKAIQTDNRKESAIKDLATVLHQQGKTEEACQILLEYREQYSGDVEKYDNLLRNLKKQINPTGKCFNKFILIEGLEEQMDEEQVKLLFHKPSRILKINFFKNYSFSENDLIRDKSQIDKTFKNVCLIQFESYSKAKKTIETLNHLKFENLNQIKLYWVNIFGKITGKIQINKSMECDSPFKDDRKNFQNPFFGNNIWNDVFLMHFSPDEDEAKPFNPNKLDWNTNKTNIPYSSETPPKSKSEKKQYHFLNDIILDRENREQICFQDINIDEFIDSLLV